MSYNVEAKCWTTRVDNEKVEFDYADCFCLAAMYEPVLELGGLAYADKAEIIERAEKAFPGLKNVENVIDGTLEGLSSLGLCAVKTTTAGVKAALTNEGVTVSKRMFASIRKHYNLVKVTEIRNDNPLFKDDWYAGPHN